MVKTQSTSTDRPCTAFAGVRRIGSGELREVAVKAKRLVDRGGTAAVLIFDDRSGEVIDVDYRGSERAVVARLAGGGGSEGRGETLGTRLHSRESGRGTGVSPECPQSLLQRGPGRPRLGVVGREVTLLPRHWEWLNSQPGGASVALRKLVEEARRVNAGRDGVRRSQEAAYRFMSAMAGDEPGYEEALRALFAGKRGKLEECIAEWPIDVRDYAKKLAGRAFGETG
jgi:hypothetical protein